LNQAEPSDDGYRVLLKSIDAGFCLIELCYDAHGLPKLYLREVNRAFARLTGQTDVLGKDIYDVFPDLHDDWKEVAVEIVETGEPFRHANYSLGAQRYSIFCSRFGGQGGRLIAVLFSDVTAQREAEIAIRASERRNALLLKLSDTLRATGDEAAMGQVAMKLLADYLEVDRSYLTRVLIDEDQAVVGPEHTRPGVMAPPMAGVYRLSDYPELMRRLALGALPIPDVASDPRILEPERGLLLSGQLQALLLVPLHRGEGNVAWTLTLASRSPRNWTSEEVALVREVAERTCGAIEYARAEAALARSEAKYRTLFETMDQGFAVYEPVRDLQGRIKDFRFVELNAAVQQMTDRTIDDLRGRTMAESLPPATARSLIGHCRAVLVTGEPRRVEQFSEPSNWRQHAFSRRGDFVVNVFDDITERKRAEMALRESEAQLEAALSAGQMAHWRWELVPDVLTYSNGMKALIGVTDHQSDLSGEQALAFVHPEDRSRHRAVVEAAVKAGSGWSLQYRLVRPDNGQTIWLEERANPTLNPFTGKVVFSGLVWDVTARKRAEGRQDILLAELQHRVRNVLATVRSLVRRTMETGESVEQVSALLDGRITALARTQALLTRAAGAGVDLEGLIREELLAQGADDVRVTVEGPGVDLAPKAAEVLTLAVHELATNATKYGAIGQNGRIVVTWRLETAADGVGWLHLSWTEHEVRVLVGGPRRKGFGAELIERRVPYELKGRGRTVFRPGGLSCEISFPLVPGESILETACPASDESGGS